MTTSGLCPTSSLDETLWRKGGEVAELGEVIEKLRASLEGVLVTPESDDYDEVRQVHNGLIDKRPRLVVRCRTPRTPPSQ